MVLPSASGVETDAWPALLDDLVPAAGHLRWVSLSRGGQDAARLLAHPLLADGQVWLREQPARAERTGPLAALEHGTWADDVRYLWFLSADARPRPEALARLTAVLRESERVAVVGPKLVRAEAPRLLVGVGHRITRWGRSAEGADVGAYDQGQLDDRSDVIGVPLEGMLVRRDVLEDLGRLAVGSHPGVTGLDVCWRAHLRGHRVQVAPEAVVAVTAPPPSDGDVATGVGTKGELQERARARAELALARTAWWRLAPRALAMLASGLWATFVLLCLRRPRAASVAWAEGTAVLCVRHIWRSRQSFRGSAGVSERDLAGVFDPGRAARPATRLTALDAPLVPAHDLPGKSVGAPSHGPADGHDRTWGRPGDHVSRVTAERSGSSIESGPAAEDLSVPEPTHTPSRWRRPGWTAAVAVAAVVTLVRWRELAGALRADGWGVLSPEVLAVSAGSSQLWSSWWLGWTGAGLGQPGPGPSWLLPMTGLTWLAEHLPGGPDDAHGAAVVTAWVVCASVLTSVLVAYAAARVVVSSRPVRAVVALGWAGLAPLVASVDSARLGPAVVHVVAPAVVAGAVLSLREGRRGRAAACATALLVAATAWWVPAVVAVGPVLGVVVAIRLRGAARLRGLVLVVVPVLLLGPHLAQYVADPVLWFGGAGATVAGAVPVAGWQGLLLHPGGPVRISIWWVVPAWLLAVVAVFGPGGRLATGLMLGGLAGIAAGLVASRVVVGTLPVGYAEAGLGVTMWPGTFLSLGGAAVLMASALGAQRLVETVRCRRRGASCGAVVLAVAGVAAVAMMGVQAATPLGEELDKAPAPLPAVVAERAAGPDQVRLLTLTPVPAGSQQADGFAVRYDIQGAEPTAWLRDRARDVVASAPGAGSGEPAPETTVAGGRPVDDLVADLVAAQDSSWDEASPTERQLADLAIGYVAVAAADDHSLAAQVDRDPALTRVSSEPGTVLWRVLPRAAGSRVWLQGATDERGTPVPSAGPHGRTQAEVGDGDQVLVVAEPTPWAQAARVRADGVTVSAERGFPVRYPLPRSAQNVVVDVPPQHPRWWWATLGVALVTACAAAPSLVPARRRR